MLYCMHIMLYQDNKRSNQDKKHSNQENQENEHSK